MKAAFVTGGSRGLGAAVCDEYRSRGWTVTEFSRSGAGVHVDLAHTRAAADAFDAAFEELPAVGLNEIVVISNAAVLGPVGSVAHARLEEIEAHIDTNVVSAALLARAFLGRFQECECAKTLVNVSSGAAVKGHAGWALYCASKAAMENFVRALALEQAQKPYPIRAINVNPGVMDTAMQAEVRASSVEDFPEHERFVRLKLDGGLADPHAVAARIADLVASRPEPGTTVSA